MLPLTLLATNKLLQRLTVNDSLTQAVLASATEAGVNVPALQSTQVIASAAAPDLADRDLQMTYPRVCLYTAQVKNLQREKFRPFSGAAAVTAEVWSSGNLEGTAELALHFYVEAVASILRNNRGDWGDGVRYTGAYDIQVQTPKPGGLGFVQSARVTCVLDVSF